MPGLSVSQIVNVTVNMTPLPVPLRNFGALVIIGPTEGIIDVGERLRPYTTLDSIAADFGTTVPEYLAANLFFSQAPQPGFVYIGRWAQTATHGWLRGATLSTAQQSMTLWNAITAGSMTISIDGTPHTLSNLNFASATNMNGIASIIQAALPGGTQVIWDASNHRFKVRGIVTGINGAVSYATATGGGTDISGTALTPRTGLSLAAGASTPVAGIAAETPVACLTALSLASNDWYGAMFAPTLSTDITDQQYIDSAALIEGLNPSRLFGITTMSATVPDITNSSDLASSLEALSYQHTTIQYSSSSAYAVAAMLGRAFTVDFTANNSMITLKFKQEPGVVAEFLSASQATALKNKNCNVFVNYNNNTAIIQEGVMCGGFFFDERQGLDWLQNNVQTTLYNILYTSTTKIPMTDPGMHVLVTGVESAMISGINNGLIAPGTWATNSVFGTLVPNQFLDRGYYVFCPQISSISEAQRAARIAPTIQAAVKLAGAVHFANCIINVNR